MKDIDHLAVLIGASVALIDPPFVRRNKGRDDERQHEVCRHERPDVVSPVVIEAYHTSGEAELRRAAEEAGMRARVLLAALDENGFAVVSKEPPEDLVKSAGRAGERFKQDWRRMVTSGAVKP